MRVLVSKLNHVLIIIKMLLDAYYACTCTACIRHLFDEKWRLALQLNNHCTVWSRTYALPLHYSPGLWLGALHGSNPWLSLITWGETRTMIRWEHGHGHGQLKMMRSYPTGPRVVMGGVHGTLAMQFQWHNGRFCCHGSFILLMMGLLWTTLSWLWCKSAALKQP